MGTTDELLDKKHFDLRVINRDVLKYIAVVAMFIGHFLTYTISELKLLGIPRDIADVLMNLQFIAPPIFFFFIAEGFCYTKSKKKYAIRLFGFAIITQCAFVLVQTLTFDVVMFFTNWNVIMSLFLGLVVLIIWEWNKTLPLRVLLIAGCCALSYALKMEWAITGQLIILVFHIFRERRLICIVLYEFIMLCYIAISSGGINAIFRSWEFVLATFFAVILSKFFYNGKKGKYPNFSKYFFYIFYPAHWLLIYLVKVIAG